MLGWYTVLVGRCSVCQGGVPCGKSGVLCGIAV